MDMVSAAILQNRLTGERRMIRCANYCELYPNVGEGTKIVDPNITIYVGKDGAIQAGWSVRENKWYCPKCSQKFLVESAADILRRL